MTTDSPITVAWIVRAADVITEQAPRLTELDSAIGDGDHGANMSRGLTAAVAAIREKEPDTAGKTLIMAGREMIAKTGGASGPLYGSGLRKAGKALDEVGATDTAAFAEALAAMLTAVEELGGATVGDKTMIDALAPAVAVFHTAAEEGTDLHSAAKAAAEAAEEGLAATIPLQARKGRASYLGPRSIGHEDPGAASTALLLRALADVTAES
jgi:dihydroxyacetone kinase-like protein